MSKGLSVNLTSSLVKAFAIGIGLVFCFLFMKAVLSLILLFLLAIVFAVILNTPVSWLEQKKIPRSLATLLMLLLILVVAGVFSWSIVPIMTTQVKNLVNSLPEYNAKLNTMLAQWKVQLPPMSHAVTQLGAYSISFLGGLILSFVLISLTAYMVVSPRPLLRLYLSLFPSTQRGKAENVFINTSRMLNGWMRANLIGGAIEGVSTVIFLSIMNVPGAWVWGILALISQMIPKVGFYFMVIPPTLIALSISPVKAVWVLSYYLILNEILGDFVMPRLRASSMNLHPVMLIFTLLVMGSAFGFIGILLSTPVAAFLKTAYEEFFLSNAEEDAQMEVRIDAMMHSGKRRH